MSQEVETIGIKPHLSVSEKTDSKTWPTENIAVEKTYNNN